MATLSYQFAMHLYGFLSTIKQILAFIVSFGGHTGFMLNSTVKVVGFKGFFEHEKVTQKS